MVAAVGYLSVRTSVDLLPSRPANDQLAQLRSGARYCALSESAKRDGPLLAGLSLVRDLCGHFATVTILATSALTR